MAPINRDQSKKEYLAYCAKAIDLSQSSPLKVQIQQHAVVHPMEDGAFVEAVIWIPRKAILCECGCGQIGLLEELHQADFREERG